MIVADGGWSGQHAACVVVGEAGVLILGTSGAGKSRLVLAMLAEQRPHLHVRLVADDRVLLRPCHDRLIARAHPAIEGLLELRGVGLIPWPHATGVVVRLVVCLVSDMPERLPEAAGVATIEGVALPRLDLWSRCHDHRARILLMLARQGWLRMPTS